MNETLYFFFSASIVLVGLGVGFWLSNRSSKKEASNQQEAYSIEKKALEEKNQHLSQDLLQQNKTIEAQRESISTLQVRNAHLESQVEQMNKQIIPELRKERAELNQQLDESRSNQLELEKKV